MSTILIADDEARIRRLVSDFLKRDGHTILEAADGKAALELIENRRLWDPEQNKVSTSRRSARTVADYLGSREKKASEK